MSQQLQLVAIARHLSQLIDQQITSSPGEPQLVISALKMLIPQAEGFLTQIEQLPNEEQQWNHVIHFIETQIFDQGMEFGFQKLDTEEIIEVYKVVVEMVQQAIGDEDQQHQEEGTNKRSQDQQDEQINHGQERQNHRDSQNLYENQPENRQQQNGSNRTASGKESSSNQHLKHVEFPSKKQASNIKNQQSLNYIENVKKQQKQKKKQLLNHQKPAQPKGRNKKDQQLKQENGLKSKTKNEIKPVKKPQEKQKITNVQKQKKQKSSSVICKPQHQNSKHNQSSQQTHTKSVIKDNNTNKNTNNLNEFNEFNQKHNKSQNEPKKQKNKKERPNTAVNKTSQQKQQIQAHQNKIKNKKSLINLNQKQKPNQEESRPKSVSRNKRESNIMDQPLEEVVVQTIQEVMRKKQKKVSERELKRNPLMRDNYVTEIMQKAARTYKYEAKKHKKQEKQKQEQQKSTKLSVLSQNQPKKNNYMKLLKQKQQAMESQVLNSQLKYYYQLRDKKLAYIKHMHKLMEKLEKERNIDLHKKQSQLTKHEKQKIRKKIEQADNLFRDNMKGIKENYLKEREKNRVNAGQQIKVLTQMQKNLVKDKENQLNLMKTLWEQERMKLDLIAKDQEKIKTQLEDMYRKHKI